MAVSYTVTFWIGAGINAENNTPYTSTWIQSGSNAATSSGLTLPSNLTDSATVNLVVRSKIDGTNNEGYLYQYPHTSAATSDFYLCDSNGNNEVFIEEISSSSEIYTHNNPKTVNLRPLAGKKLYIKNKLITTNPKLCMRGDFRITITYDTYTDCTAPTSVSVSRTRSVCSVSWSGQSNGTNNTISNYKIIVKEGSASESGATELGASPATSSPVTTQPNGVSPTASKTYYFGVRSQAKYNNSAYKWSGAVTVPAKPSVSAGSVITKAQMDNLKTWINGSQTAVTQYDTAKASVGNTYKSGLTAGSTAIDDAWYNNAASGT